MKDIPIIFFQAGDARHLPYTFWQARHWAQGSPVILLGDKLNQHYRGVEHVPVSDFSSAMNRFRERYVHISSNSWDFEFFSLARWFVIEEFTRKQGIRELLYLDSDVLLFEAPGKIFSEMPDCKMTLAWQGNQPPEVVSGGQSLIRDAAILGEFCRQTLEIYLQPRDVQELHERFDDLVRKKKGGASDMWFLARFARRQGGAIANSWEPEKDGVFDLNMLSSDGFMLEKGLKKIRFKDGQPHAFHELHEKWVRFGSLHFSGESKKKISSYLGRTPDLSLLLSCLKERCHKGFRSIAKKRVSDLGFLKIKPVGKKYNPSSGKKSEK